MDKDKYWEEKNARLRFQKMKKLLKTGKGTHRVRWEGQGEWVYDNAEEAQADADRIAKENSAVVRAWVESKDESE